MDKDLSFIEECGGYYVDKRHGDDCEEKVVYLTFDAGYENGNVDKILNILKAENVKAAFFIVGNLISHDPELVIRMTNEGHIVANHTYYHKDMTTCKDITEFKNELEHLETAYRELTNREMPRYYRPPEGKFDLNSLLYANRLGYKTIFWSFAYADWDNAKQPTAHYAKQKIYENLHNGAVILLHPTSATNVEILPDIIKALKNDGYRFGTLDELTK